ncbi:hypothetical protein [Sphingorhabdus sp. 109]|jgi:hypothetical protein|uniref:hypothetical protein n=1 Tax=Sphingorhabdus sp. 109 TaxID=2653173 RepID=UPI0012EFC5DB|nr:hypothetical protein [Sphingorhabdus sp. 109]VWX61395.1 Acid phosphatase [Sphingorhabdus sp. 109]
MAQIRLSLLILTALPLLSGCVAAILPLAAIGTMGKAQIDRTKAKQDLVASGAIDLAIPAGSVTIGLDGDEAVEMREKDAGFAGQGGAFEIAGLDLERKSADRDSPVIPTPGLDASPYADFAAHALQQSAKLEAGEGVDSVVLVPRVDIFEPETIECEGKPLAVLIDLDSPTGGDLIKADTLYRQNGLVEALSRLHSAEISVIWLSDHPVAASGRISAILNEAGLSRSGSDDFLFLDRGGDDRKQVRRWDAARNYCIVAIAGDDRADFDELYDYLLEPDGAIALNHMFDNGWFLTPPPLVEATRKPTAKPDDKEG